MSVTPCIHLQYDAETLSSAPAARETSRLGAAAPATAAQRCPAGMILYMFVSLGGFSVALCGVAPNGVSVASGGRVPNAVSDSVVSVADESALATGAASGANDKDASVEPPRSSRLQCRMPLWLQ